MMRFMAGKHSMPVGRLPYIYGETALVEGVFAAEVLDTLAVEMEETGGGGLVAARAAESSGEESDLHLLDLMIEVGTGFG